MFKHVLPLCLPLLFATHNSPGALLSEDFGVGYTTLGDIAGQSGGSGWEPGSAWVRSLRSGLFAGIVTSGLGAIDGATLQITSPRRGSSILGGVSRGYDAVGLDAPYTLSFTVKVGVLGNLALGGFEADNNTNAWRYLNIFDRPGAVADFGADGSWLIRGGQFNADGRTITNGTATNAFETAYDSTARLNWYAFNYDPLVENVFTDADVVDTGIALGSGKTYRFDVGILGAGLWNLSLTDGISTFRSTTNYGFRSASPLPSTDLHFGLRDRNLQSGGIIDIIEETYDVRLSVDNISIPEPSAAILLGLTTLAYGIRRRRR